MVPRPSIRIREVAEADLRAVQALNLQSVPAVNSLTRDHLRWFASEAECFRVAAVDSVVAGFLICLAPQAAYGSPNFQWLRQRYEDFLYIDRVAVAARFQRLGIATALYADAARRARASFVMLACEVNIRPRNEESMRFHRGLGFTPVGSKDHGNVEVQYMLRPLPLGLVDETRPQTAVLGKRGCQK